MAPGPQPVHVQATQAELVAHQFGVFVLLLDRVAAPAHHHVGLGNGLEHIGVAQDVKDGVRHPFRGGESKRALLISVLA
jgi:hypothetical protein